MEWAPSSDRGRQRPQTSCDPSWTSSRSLRWWRIGIPRLLRATTSSTCTQKLATWRRRWWTYCGSCTGPRTLFCTTLRTVWYGCRACCRLESPRTRPSPSGSSKAKTTGAWEDRYFYNKKTSTFEQSELRRFSRLLETFTAESVYLARFPEYIHFCIHFCWRA